MAVIHGRHLIIKVNGTAIAGAKSCEINVEGEQLETASPDTGTWRTFLAGRKEWSVTCGYLIPAAGTPLRSEAAMVNTTVTLTMQSGMSGDTLTGSAIVRTWRASGNIGNLAQGSFQFRGNGALG